MPRPGVALARRAAVCALVVSVVAFAVPAWAPGPTIDALLGARRDDPAAIAQATDQFRLDQAVVVQYVAFVAAAVRGDLGTSPQTGAAVGPAVAARLWVTIASIAITLALTLAISLAISLAMGPRSRGSTSAQRSPRLRVPMLSVVLVAALAVELLARWGGVAGLVRDAILRGDAATARGGLLVLLSLTGLVVVAEQARSTLRPSDDRAAHPGASPRGVAVAGGLVMAAGVALLLARRGWYVDADTIALSEARAGISGAHPLGTDPLGRDVLARTLVALRGSLSLAALAVVTGTVAAVVAGAALGFAGGRTADRARVELAALRPAVWPVVVLSMLAVADRAPERVAMLLGVGVVPMIAAVVVTTTVAAGAVSARARERSAQRTARRALRLGARPLAAVVARAVAAVVALEAFVSLAGAWTDRIPTLGKELARQIGEPRPAVLAVSAPFVMAAGCVLGALAVARSIAGRAADATAQRRGRPSTR